MYKKEELDSVGYLVFSNLTVNVDSGKRSHVGGFKNPLINFEVANHCNAKQTLLKGRSIGF